LIFRKKIDDSEPGPAKYKPEENFFSILNKKNYSGKYYEAKKLPKKKKYAHS